MAVKLGAFPKDINFYSQYSLNLMNYKKSFKHKITYKWLSAKRAIMLL